MPRKYLINSTRLGTQLHYAGTSFDTVLEATIIEQMVSCGAVLVDSTPEVLSAAAKAEILREQGAEPYMCDAVMISACDNSDTVTYNDDKVGPQQGQRQYRKSSIGSRLTCHLVAWSTQLSTLRGRMLR